MARVFIDPHMFGEQWFLEIKGDLVRAPSVRFAYSGLRQEGLELSKKRAALEFFQLMGKAKKRDDANPEVCERNQGELISNGGWLSNRSTCDDPHIFSLVKTLPTPYVFSCDSRMASCRDCLSGNLDSEYLRFSIIQTRQIYLRLKQSILA